MKTYMTSPDRLENLHSFFFFFSCSFLFSKETETFLQSLISRFFNLVLAGCFVNLTRNDQRLNLISTPLMYDETPW